MLPHANLLETQSSYFIPPVFPSIVLAKHISFDCLCFHKTWFKVSLSQFPGYAAIYSYHSKYTPRRKYSSNVVTSTGSKRATSSLVLILPIQCRHAHIIGQFFNSTKMTKILLKETKRHTVKSRESRLITYKIRTQQYTQEEIKRTSEGWDYKTSGRGPDV